MAVSEAVYAQGTLFQRETAPASGVYTTIAECKSISGPEVDRDEIEVTHQESPDRHRETIAGLRDSGVISFDVNFLPGNATQDHITGLIADQISGTKRNYRLVFPSSPVYRVIVPGFVKKFAISAPVDGVLGASVEVRVTSAPTFGAGA